MSGVDVGNFFCIIVDVDVIFEVIADCNTDDDAFSSGDVPVSVHDWRLVLSVIWWRCKVMAKRSRLDDWCSMQRSWR